MPTVTILRGSSWSLPCPLILWCIRQLSFSYARKSTVDSLNNRNMCFNMNWWSTHLLSDSYHKLWIDWSLPNRRWMRVEKASECCVSMTPSPLSPRWSRIRSIINSRLILSKCGYVADCYSSAKEALSQLHVDSDVGSKNEMRCSMQWP